jgi:hypothetical protein
VPPAEFLEPVDPDEESGALFDVEQTDTQATPHL